MPKFQIKTASRQGLYLKMALMGPTGSGKTYSALAIASGLGKRVCVIDTERGSASLYSDQFAFDVIDDFEDYNPKNYIEAMNVVVKAGYDVLIVDSLSHAWNGKGGILEIVDDLTSSSKSHNAYTAGWPTGTRLHNDLMNAILTSPIHVIATMRSKMDYVLQDEGNGKKAPAKVGLAPVQRDGVEYEFTVIGDLNLNHTMAITKTRIKDLDGQMVRLPGAEFGASLVEWLGTPPPPKPEPAPAPKPAPRPTPEPMPAVEPEPEAEPSPRPQPVPAQNSTPAPTPTASDPATPEVIEAREKLYSLLLSYRDGNVLGYGDMGKIQADVRMVLGVDRISESNNVDAMVAWRKELLKQRAATDVPFGDPVPEQTIAQEYGMLHEPAQEMTPAQKLRSQIESSMLMRHMSGVEKTMLASADELADRGDLVGLKSIIKSVEAYPLKSKTTPEIATLLAEVASLHQQLVDAGIDGFENSKRLTNSVQAHLGVKKYTDCKDPALLSEYILALREKLEDNHVA